MSILEKFTPLRAQYAALRKAGDPFAVSFDDILSSTEGVVNGRRTILLGTNNYLGLTFDEASIEKSVEAVRRHGTGTTGSRIANGSYDGHRRLERELAKFYGQKHCMVFTTGYQANLGMLSTLVGKDDHLIIDSDSHASIYDGSRLGHAPVVRFRHNNPDDLAKRLRRLENEPGSKLIVVEGIYSMLGDTAPLREIVEIKKEYGAYLMVDEAHSMGVLGERGRGLAEAAGVEEDVDFIVGTFSKSLSSVGGFCVSNMEGFDILRVACRPYMFTASLPPAVIASTLQALQTLQEEPVRRVKLAANARRLYNGLLDLGFEVGPECNPIVSVMVPDPGVATAFWRALLDSGVYMNLALPPATPNSCAFLRSSVSAVHTPKQIDYVLETMGRLGVQFGVLPSEAEVALSAGRPAATGAKESILTPELDGASAMA
jgi:8-amino-7-oxononanoate synthase